jgi:kelch-like protein 8
MNKRRAGASVTVINNRLYILGENELCFVLLINYFISGGFDDNSPLDSVECFDPDANLWTMVPNMTSCRGGVGSATLGKEFPFCNFCVIALSCSIQGGRIYSVGGHDGSTYLRTVEAYDAENQQ